MEKLQVGDVIYTHNNMGYTSHKIDRVTEKNAFSGSTRFVRQSDGGSFKIVGPQKWGPYSAEKMNPRIEKYLVISKYKQAIDMLVKKLGQVRELPNGVGVDEVRAKTEAIKTICESI